LRKKKNINQLKYLKKIKANYLFVGDDWFKNKSWIDMEKKLKKIKCKVIYFPYILSNNVFLSIFLCFKANESYFL